MEEQKNMAREALKTKIMQHGVKVYFQNLIKALKLNFGI